MVEFIPGPSDGASVQSSDATLSGKHIWNALRDGVVANFGDTGWGAVGASLTG